MQKTFPFRNWLPAAALLGLSAGPALAQTAGALPAGVSRVTSVEGEQLSRQKNVLLRLRSAGRSGLPEFT